MARCRYRELFAIREFRVLFLNRCVVMLSVAASSLALGTITFQATGSAVLTAMAMFGGPLVSLVASQLLLASLGLGATADGPHAADGRAAARQRSPGGARHAVAGSVRPARRPGTSSTRCSRGPSGSWCARSCRDRPGQVDLQPRRRRHAGRRLRAGGVALLWLSPAICFLVAALADAVCLVNVRLGLRDRPARGAGGGGGVVRRTAAVNRLLLGSRVTRPLYVAMWVPNGLVVGAEALYVPYGHGSVAGYLFAAAAAGMMVGDLVVGRFVPPHRRDGLIGPLRVTLAAPYLVLLLRPPVAVTVVVAFVASVGYAAGLPLQERLFEHTDHAVQGRRWGSTARV